MSKILCIIDGMTDARFRAEDYPNLSALRLLRYADTTCGQPPESLGCILRLLGVQKIPANFRGYVEAVGNGIAVGSHDLVLRGSWFALDRLGNCTVPTRAPESLPETAAYRYYPLGEYKSIFVFPNMAGFVTEITTRPPYIGAECSAEHLRPSGCRALSRAFDELKTDGRCMIPWGQAVSASLPRFPQKGAVVCAAAIVKGIARLLGLELWPIPGAATGDVDTDLQAKSRAALQAAKEYPFVLLHINGADEAAHRKSSEEKQRFLHRVDDIVLTLLLASGHEVYVASDHGTDPLTGTHLSGPQPIFTNVPDPSKKKNAEPSVSSESTSLQQRSWAIAQLREKAAQTGRLPTKADFEDLEIIKIKRALGPWPRALEKAELKEKRKSPAAHSRREKP